MNANHFQLLDRESRLFCGLAKNLRGPVPVHGPEVENHCLVLYTTIAHMAMNLSTTMDF